MRTANLLVCFTIPAGCTGHQTFDDGSDAVEQSPGPGSDAGSPSQNGSEPSANEEGTPPQTNPGAPSSLAGVTPVQPMPGPTQSGPLITPQPLPVMSTPAGPETDVGCGEIQCFRAIECVEECGGPIVQASCCPCDEGTFDSLQCTRTDAGVEDEPSDAGAPDDGDGGTGGDGMSVGGSSNGGSGAGGSSSGGSSDGGSGGSSNFDLEELNSDCVDAQCPDGLTPTHYYGIAGESGPLFCSCSFPCDEDPDVCPEGSSCVTISDGPGTVCYVTGPTTR